MGSDFLGLIFIALALMFVFEGLLYAIFPGAMQRMMALVLEMSVDDLRRAGLIAAIFGLGAVWLIKSTVIG